MLKLSFRLVTTCLSLALLIFTQLTSAENNAAPAIAQGIQMGLLGKDQVLIWSRSDKPARMMLQYADNPNFTKAKLIKGGVANIASDFTTRYVLNKLSLGTDIYLKVWFVDVNNLHLKSEVAEGHFHIPAENEDIHFAWGADTGGQGWGINPSFGGMKIYKVMLQHKPQFFIQNGDSIYADNPIPASVIAENGQVWENLQTPAVTKVAVSLNEFRGRYLYNLLDVNRRQFNAEVPLLWQWDDHELLNNWSPGKDLSQDQRYQVKSLKVLLNRAAKAFHEYTPLPYSKTSKHLSLYRKISYGNLLDVFILDMRSYRGANSFNLQTVLNSDSAFLGAKQTQWLEHNLQSSQAVWKVIAADMPIGLNIPDGKDAQGRMRWEGLANGDNGPAAGRELEMASLLHFIKKHAIHNIVWLTGDVHYAAAHYYDPMKAATSDFLPFWEFVAGPLNAGSFGPNSSDGTFGLQVMFSKAPPAGQSNLSPYAGLQFFGNVTLKQENKNLTVDLIDISGLTVFSKTLLAE